MRHNWSLEVAEVSVWGTTVKCDWEILKGQWGGKSNCSSWATLHNAFLMQWLIIVIIFTSKDAGRAKHIYFLFFSLPEKYNISSVRGIPYVSSLYLGSMFSYVAANGELPCFHDSFCDCISLFQYQLHKADQSTPSPWFANILSWPFGLPAI